jgi:hypothetical protein
LLPPLLWARLFRQMLCSPVRCSCTISRLFVPSMFH